MAIRSVPQPPFSTELLADLHAGNVEPELSDRLWSAARGDAEAHRYLCALDDVSDRVRALGREELILHAMPGDVAARMERFLDELEPLRPSDDILPFPSHNGSAPSDVATPAPVDLREHRGTRRWLAAAAAAVAVVGSVGVAVTLSRDDEAVAPTAQPPSSAGQAGDELTATAALAALGRNDVSGPLGNRAALTRCVEAAGLQRAILGSTDMTYQGKNAVLVLLSGPNPPKITALVVGPGCTTGDPQVRNVTDIG
ncbi:hypothetical protein [Nocardia arizonensis]|uniref:hypothetical protein n=1 Tax=Nocardia arizonensis TaxID=1141647 RepID=UPI0006D103A1|nr:hypothetical protein [Nocardia arizonensis]